jgi:acyl-CoA thioesterase
MDRQDVKRYINEKNALSRLLGIEVTEIGEGSATCVMQVRDDHMNPFGTVNAGATYALAETAFGAAANAHGEVTVAVNLSIAYLNPATGGTLTARAEELSSGGRMATYAVRVTDESGTLVADAQAMGYRTRKPLGDLALTGPAEG